MEEGVVSLLEDEDAELCDDKVAYEDLFLLVTLDQHRDDARYHVRRERLLDGDLVRIIRVEPRLRQLAIVLTNPSKQFLIGFYSKRRGKE